MKIDLRQVHKRITRLCQQHNVTYLATANPNHVLYLTGLSVHSPMDAFILITPSWFILFSDNRYRGTIDAIADRNPLIKSVVWNRLDLYTDVMKHVPQGASVGFEGASVHSFYSYVLNFRKAAQARGVIARNIKADIVGAVRMVKFPGEMAVLKRAFQVSDRAYEYVLPLLKPGVTELSVAQKLNAFMREQSGSDEISFATIIASGPHSATPHATAGQRKLRKRDIITLDFGCVIENYRSDMTRTVFIGKPTALQQNIWETVFNAQQAAEHAASIGLTGNDVDAVARQIIEDSGYGDFFNHSTGHGVGVETHERPYITPSKVGKNVLEENQVFTIEPGIYLPGQFGVRIENTGVMTKRGFVSLCKSDMELTVL